MSTELIKFDLTNHFNDGSHDTAFKVRQMLESVEKRVSLVEQAATDSNAQENSAPLKIVTGSNDNDQITDTVDTLIADKTQNVLVVKELALDRSDYISVCQFEALKDVANFAFVNSAHEAVEIVRNPELFKAAQQNTWKLVHQAYC